MEVLYLLIPMGLILMLAAGGVFVWTLFNGQYDNLEEIGGRLPDDD